MEEIEKQKVAAITVTYNRTITLRRCLEALLSQTREVDEIIIVDNNSRAEEKEQLKLLAAQKENIHLVMLDDNMGGAGGFEAGMKKAKEFQPDWYWLMDDDAYPREDCLEVLLKYSRILKEKDGQIGFLAPLIYGIDLQEYQLYHHKQIQGITFVNVPTAENVTELSPVTKIEANAFVGPLITKEAVEKFGVADGSLFIYGDDTEYTYRLTRKMNGYLIKNAVIDHQDPPLSANYLEPKAWWKEYYSNRNRYFMVRKFHKNRCKRFLAYIALTIPIVKLMTAALIKPKYKGFRVLRVQMLSRSVLDGMKNQRGKTLDPVKYGKMIQERKEK